MAEGAVLEDAMRQSLEELDGVFTYICVTEDALGMAKDELAAKPLVLYEADDLVALASEEIAIRAVVDREIDTYDPYEGEVMVWHVASRGSRTTRAASSRSTARRRASPRSTATRATFDARDLTTRKINAELRRLVYEEGVRDVTIRNPGAQHSLGVGILQRCRITFDGSLGYFGCGLIDGPEIHVKGRVGWSACENMMSRRRRHRRQRRLAHRGGDPRRRRRRARAASARARASTRRAARSSSRGSAGSMTGFMMQRGRQIILGDVGPGLGDSMYDGTIYVGGKVKSLGVDCVPGEWTDADTEFIERKFRIYGLGDPPRAAEVRLRQAALQLRHPRAVRAQARAVRGGRHDG